MFSPDATAPNAAAASTSSHATSTIQRWRKLPRPRRSSTRAMFTPWSTVQDTRQVSVTCRWHHGSGDDPGRRRPGGSASAAHASAPPGCPALARTGTQPRRDLRRRRRRPGHREPQHLLPALPRHRHAAGRRPRRAGRPRRRRPHPDPPRRSARGRPPTCWSATPPTSPRTSACTAARWASTAPPSPSPACADASPRSRPRASSSTALPRRSRTCPLPIAAAALAGSVIGVLVAWLERDPLPRAGRGVLGLVGRQRLARRGLTTPNVRTIERLTTGSADATPAASALARVHPLECGRRRGAVS